MSAIIVDYEIVMKDGADPSTSTAVNRINSKNIVTNWITMSTATIGATDSSARFHLTDIGCRWVRLFWDSTSGTGNTSSFRASFKGY